MSLLTFPDADTLTDLRTYAARARSLDAGGAIRLQCTGAVLAAYVGVLPGTGLLGEGTVIGLRVVRLAQELALDVTVPLGAVADRLARAGPQETTLPVPPASATVAWAALTPPRSGWQRVGSAATEDVLTEARKGIATVAQAAGPPGDPLGGLPGAPAGDPAGDPADEPPGAPADEPPGAPAGEPPGASAGGLAVDSLRRRVWGAPTGTVPPFPAGGAFAAYVLGFCRPGGEVAVHTNGRWTRLSTPVGYVLIR